jgi:adenosine deaminase
MLLPDNIRRVPKVDLHVHIEGTITPDLVKRIAHRNKVTVPAELLSGKSQSFHWKGEATAKGSLRGFLAAYDQATSVMRKAQDYVDVIYDYLKRSSDEGCIYAEVVISADHGAMVGLTYPQLLDAISQGYEKAKKETGIEMRLISTCVRHYGPEGALKVGELTGKNPHPLVTGFGMAGDENAFTIADFKPAYDAAGPLGRTAHAGEASGPETVRQARDILKIRRFGHMVRAIEDPALIEEQKAINAVPEVCVSSNMALKVFAEYKQHPVRKFFDAGLKVTFGSDDPPFFRTSIGREYQLAYEKFGFTEKELVKVSRNAIEEAFVDEATRGKLLQRLETFKAAA